MVGMWLGRQIAPNQLVEDQSNPGCVRAHQSIGCEGRREIQLVEGPPPHFQCIVGCEGDTWDVCGWPGWLVMLLLTPYFHTYGGVN